MTGVGGTPGLRGTGGRASASRGSGFSVVAALLTSLVVIVIAFSVVWAVVAFRIADDSARRIDTGQRALTNVRVYDEVLTNSARMAALTGESSWVDRYRQAESRLTESLRVARDSTQGWVLVDVLATNAANEALVKLEHQSLAAAQAGNFGEAKSILDSTSYAQLKDQYAKSLANAQAAYDSDLEQEVVLWKRLMVLQLIVSLAMVAVIVILARLLTRRAEKAERVIRDTMDSAVIGMATVSPAGEPTYANASLATMLGYSIEGILETALIDLVHPDDFSLIEQAWQAVECGDDDRAEFRVRMHTATGDTIWVDCSLASVRSREGGIHHYVVQVVNVTPEMRSIDAARDSAEKFRLLAENATDIVYRTDAQGRIVWISAAVSEILGWRPEELEGGTIMTLIDPRDASLVLSGRERTYAGVATSDMKVRMLTRDHVPRLMSVSARPYFDEAGAVVGAVVGLRDITEEAFLRGELERSERLFRLAAVGAPSGIALADKDGIFIEANPALCRILGRTRGEIVGTTLAVHLLPEDTGTALVEASVLRPGEDVGFEHEHRMQGAEGQPWVKHSISILRDAENEPYLFVHHFVDETQAHELQRELAYRASHDVLTGVSNRADLMSVLHRYTDEALAATALGVIFCDVDRLKPVNDEFGHLMGDAVLEAAAARMVHAVRAGDVVARIGGDEFVVLLPGVSEVSEVARIAESIRASVDGPVRNADAQVVLTISLGATVTHAGESADAVLTRADQALYEAKRQGRDRSFALA